MPLQQISVSPLDWVKENTSSENQDWKVQEPVFTTASQRPPERCASQASTLSNNHDICRICHCEGDNEVPLIAPCYCSGSLRYVHQACLQQWIKSSDIRSCELCKFQFIMQSKIKPFSEWEALEMSGVERRKLLCSVTFHAVALTCVVWSLYVLIDRTAEEIQKGVLEWPFWTKLIVVAIGFTGGLVFMYIQCKAYLHLCRRWRAFNRVIFVQNAPEKVALPPANTQPPLAREESLLVSETCCGVVTSDDAGRGKRRANEMASAVTIDSGFHECRRKSSNKSKIEEKQTIPTSGNLLLTRADCGDKAILKRDDSGSSYQPFEGCDIGDMSDVKDTDVRDSGANVSIRDFSYDETAQALPVNDCEEMSHLLQGEDRKCENVCRISGNHQGSSGFAFLPSSIPGSLDGRGKFRDDTSTSCAVSTSSSEESFQSPSIQLLQQSRKSANGAGLQQAPTLPVRPWTVGPSNSGITWAADVAADRITNGSASSVRPKSSLGSQSPLLSVVKGNDDTTSGK